LFPFDLLRSLHLIPILLQLLSTKKLSVSPSSLPQLEVLSQLLSLLTAILKSSAQNHTLVLSVKEGGKALFPYLVVILTEINEVPAHTPLIRNAIDLLYHLFVLPSSGSGRSNSSVSVSAAFPLSSSFHYDLFQLMIIHVLRIFSFSCCQETEICNKVLVLSHEILSFYSTYDDERMAIQRIYLENHILSAFSKVLINNFFHSNNKGTTVTPRNHHCGAGSLLDGIEVRLENSEMLISLELILKHLLLLTSPSPSSPHQQIEQIDINLHLIQTEGLLASLSSLLVFPSGTTSSAISAATATDRGGNNHHIFFSSHYHHIIQDMICDIFLHLIKRNISQETSTFLHSDYCQALMNIELIPKLKVMIEEIMKSQQQLLEEVQKTSNRNDGEDVSGKMEEQIKRMQDLSLEVYDRYEIQQHKTTSELAQLKSIQVKAISIISFIGCYGSYYDILYLIHQGMILFFEEMVLQPQLAVEVGKSEDKEQELEQEADMDVQLVTSIIKLFQAMLYMAKRTEVQDKGNLMKMLRNLGLLNVVGRLGNYSNPEIANLARETIGVSSFSLL
jgi:hypothetical protein